MQNSRVACRRSFRITVVKRFACELDVISHTARAWVRAPGELRPLGSQAIQGGHVLLLRGLFERRSDGCRPDERRRGAVLRAGPSGPVRFPSAAATLSHRRSNRRPQWPFIHLSPPSSSTFLAPVLVAASRPPPLLHHVSCAIPIVISESRVCRLQRVSLSSVAGCADPDFFSRIGV